MDRRSEPVRILIVYEIRFDHRHDVFDGAASTLVGPRSAAVTRGVAWSPDGRWLAWQSPLEP